MAHEHAPHAELDPVEVLFMLVQSLHDVLEALVTDLGERGMVEASDYLLPEGEAIILDFEEPPAAA